MTAKTFQRTDFYAGITVSAFGIAAFVEALRMPTFVERNADPFTVPGLTPAIISAVIGVLGIMLVLRSLFANGPLRTLPLEDWPEGSVKRTVFTIITVLFYGCGLFGQVPFFIATLLFVFVFTVGAELMHPARKLGILPVCIVSLALALISAFVIEYVFTDLFLVRLPG